MATRRSPGYVKAFKTYICDSKEQALLKADMLELAHPIQVFCDGSGLEGGVGASAVLYINDNVDKILHFHLGSKRHHTVYEAEGIGIVMALHLLISRNRQIAGPFSICSDSQALLKVLDNQLPHAGHYILDMIHDFAEKLHSKQDGLFNRVDRREAISSGRS